MNNIRAHYNKHNGGHWFDADTLSFWGTKFHGNPVCTPFDGSRWYFITSEDNFDGTERLFSVRVYDMTNFQINTISIQKDKTLEGARLRLSFVTGAKVEAFD